MNTLTPIRILFLAICALGSFLVYHANPNFNLYSVFNIGLGLGLLVIILELSLKTFTLKNLIAMTVGLTVGSLISFLITSSPLFEFSDAATEYIVKLSIFCTSLYICTMVSLKSKENFNLLLPYVKFVPHNLNVPIIVLDVSALIDGRIATICQARFISAAVVVPRFVIDDLHKFSSSDDQQRQIKGKKGIETLNKLKNMNYIDLRIKDVDVDASHHPDGKIMYLCQTLKGKLLTLDYNLAKLAEFQGIEWLNLNALSKALNPEVSVGQYLDVDLVKTGKETHQGVGYLPDGSMVVVNEANEYIGQTVVAEIISVLPSAGGKMIFARLHNQKIEVA